MEFFAQTSSYYAPSAAATGLAAGFMAVSGLIILFSLIAAAVSILIIVSLWKIFKKAGKNGWEAIIPIYNIITLLEISESPMWYQMDSRPI